MTVWLAAKQPDLAAMQCRFGCESPVVGIFHAPKGCICWPDPLQALCAQHAASMESTGPVTCVIDFRAFRVLTCSRCGGPRDRALIQNYCRACHATWMKNWRAARRAESTAATGLQPPSACGPERDEFGAKTTQHKETT